MGPARTELGASGLLAGLGAAALAGVRTAGGMWLLLRRSLGWMVLGLAGRAKLPWAGAFGQMVQVGVKSLPIVCLSNLFLGMILAVSMAELLRSFNMEPRVAQVVAVSMTRELAALMTAIVMSGYVGAAMAAELGTMTVNEEVMALETSAMNPLRFLVVPRLLAVMVMLPCLTTVAFYMGMSGGYIVGVHMLNIGSAQYIEINNSAVTMRDVATSLIKAEAFGIIITVVACYEGLAVTGGAEGVGRATTRAVVLSVFLIIAANLFFAMIFNYVLV